MRSLADAPSQVKDDPLQDASARQVSTPEPGIRGQDRRQPFKRATYLVLTLVAVALSARAVFGERGALDAHRSSREMAQLRAVVEKWRERNDYLETRIAALGHDPATLESIARERLGWVRPGEITFLFPHDPAALEPGDPGPVAPGEFSPSEPGDAAQSEGAAGSWH